MREGEVLRLLRIVNGYDTLVELSKVSGINVGTLSNAERGTSYVSSATLRTLSELYDIPMCLLFYSFRKLGEYNFENKMHRKMAYAHLLALSFNSKSKLPK